MRLEDIGFYTLCDSRARAASPVSPLWRGELLLTARCNFKCPYCRHVGGRDLPYTEAAATIRLLRSHGLKHLRLSGGEPTLYPGLADLVREARGVDRIALSTNGSAPLAFYRELLAVGVNDLSISLDACCAEDGDLMAGGVNGAWAVVVENIRALSREVYLTVGVVLTRDNAAHVNETIRFAHDLGVTDIRVIPAAQCDDGLVVEVADELLAAHPILRYRIDNMQRERGVRGLQVGASNRCGLVVDDLAVMGAHHYPCIIYLREGGRPIGRLGSNMRSERVKWALEHDTHADPICRANCIDVCVDYNRRFQCSNTWIRRISTGLRGGEATRPTSLGSPAGVLNCMDTPLASAPLRWVGAKAKPCHAAPSAGV